MTEGSNRRGFFGNGLKGILAPFMLSVVESSPLNIGFPKSDRYFLEALSVPLRTAHFTAEKLAPIAALANFGKNIRTDSFYDIPKLEIGSKVEYPLDFSSYQITTKDVEDIGAAQP